MLHGEQTSLDETEAEQTIKAHYNVCLLWTPWKTERASESCQTTNTKQICLTLLRCALKD